MKRMLLGLGLGLGLLGCVPIPPGTSQVVPFELVSGRIPTITAGQSWYLAKRYDEIQWVARIIFDAEGRVRSRSIRAVSTPVTLTWSQAPDEVLWDFANSGSLFLRCTGTGLQNEYQSWPTWFYVASA